MTQTLLLIRHGQASAGGANYDRLSTRGREQSAHLGDWWASQGLRPDAVFHGTLERQRDTASISLERAGHALECSVLADLDEYAHRALDAHLREQATSDPAPVNAESVSYDDYVSVMKRWRDSGSLPEPLESWAQFKARGWNAIRESTRDHYPDATLAYFTSGGIISTVLASVLDLDFDHCIDAIWRVRNASVTTLAFDGTAARLVEFNNVTHLEVHRDPNLITLI